MPVNIVNFSPTTNYVDSVYVDTNLIVNARNRRSSTYSRAANLLGRLIDQGTALYISSLVVDELWWITLRILHRNTTGHGLSSSYLKQNPSLIGTYSNQIINTTQTLLAIPNVQMVSCNPNDVGVVNDTLDVFITEQLGPRDSFHLSLTMASNIRGFATGDGDFDTLNLPNYNLTVYKY